MMIISHSCLNGSNEGHVKGTDSQYDFQKKLNASVYSTIIYQQTKHQQYSKCFTKPLLHQQI